MKLSSTRAVGLLALMWCMSCGPAPTPERSPVAPLVVGPAAPVRPVAPAPPEAPPRAPDDLTLLARINDPEQLAREVAAIVPPGVASVAAALDPKQLLTLVFGKHLGGIVDLAQPVDIASLGANSSTFVLSMAVKQEAEGKLGEGLLLREEGGLLRIERSPDVFGAATWAGPCAFTAAAGRAPTRLVCASNDVALKKSAAYLARSVAAEPLEADARLSVPGRVVREQRAQGTRAISDAASVQLGNDLIENFLAEVERVDVDLRFVGSGVEVGSDLRLSSRDSMLARVLVPRSDPAPPPPAFFRLPADSLISMHTTGARPEDIAPLRRALGDNLEATLVRDGYQAEKTRVLRERIESLLLTGGPLVLGLGVVGGPDGAEKALGALDEGKPGGRPGPDRAGGRATLEAQARRALAPWLLVEVEEPAGTWTSALRDIVRRAEDADQTRARGSRSSTPRDPDGSHVDLKIGALAPGHKLPKDTLHLEVLITPRTKGRRPPRRAHLVVMPKGGATWLGYSEDLGAITARLRLALDDATDVGTLGKTTGAAALRARPTLAAGIVSLRGLEYLAARTSTPEGLREAARSAARHAALGLRSSESVTWGAAASTAPGGVRLSVRAYATRQATVDLLRMLGL